MTLAILIHTQNYATDFFKSKNHNQTLVNILLAKIIELVRNRDIQIWHDQISATLTAKNMR